MIFVERWFFFLNVGINQILWSSFHLIEPEMKVGKEVGWLVGWMEEKK